MTLSLALCLDAPMQSWGIRSRFTTRETTTEPTKSGVVGLLGAALGVSRDDQAALSELAALRMGVRVDREGILERDYHTAQNVPTTAGSGHRTVVSQRYYLADAVFLVVLQSEDTELLTRAAEAIQRPHWALCFGRKSFLPARPLITSGRADHLRTGAGLQEKPLEAVLAEHQWLETRPLAHQRELAAIEKGETGALRSMVECHPSTPGAEPRRDQPLSFARGDRRFTSRAVLSGHVPLTPSLISAGEPRVPEQAHR